MDETTSPTLRLWQLAELMRTYRDRANLTHEQAATKLKTHGPKWSRSKLQRIENRQYIPKPAEIEQVAQVLLIDRDATAELVRMSQEARVKGWWQRSAIPKDFHTLIGLEQAATAIRQFELALVPGLLQTPEYARAVVEATEPATPIEIAEGIVAGRMTRQHILKATERLRFQTILNEAVLHAPVGGNRIMRSQLERLLELTEQPNISIQILPFTAGANPGMEGAFSVLTLPQLAADVGYIDGHAGALYLESQDDVRRCIMRFGVLAAKALAPATSAELISTTLAAYQ